MLAHKALKARALAKPNVKIEYKKLEEEFALFDRSLKAKVGRNELGELRRMKSKSATK
ncbi:MAG: hypothetical protein WCB36_01515 [Burkholderiales bacterium]